MNTNTSVVVSPIQKLTNNHETTTDIILKGKVIGTKTILGCGPIAEAKKMLKAAGLSSKEQSEKIAEFLKGSGGNMAWLSAQASMEAARSKGMVPTVFEMREKSFVIRGQSAPVAAAGLTEEEQFAATAKLLGVTVEELMLLKKA